MPEKRPFPPGGPDKGDAKRSRSGGASQASATNGKTDEERKRAQVAERIAALKAKTVAQAQARSSAAPSSVTGSKSASTSGAAATQDALARIAAMKAKLNAGATSTTNGTPQAVPVSRSTAGGSGDNKQSHIQAQLAALKAKAAETQQQRRGLAPPPPVRDDNVVRARGGLGIGLHPALMGDLAKPAAKEQRDQEESRKRQARANPYLSQEAQDEDAKDESGFDSRLGRAGAERKSRAMIFNQKGKFIAQAEALRAQERLEKMKQELQEQTRKKAIEEATERSYLVQAPPEIEWWDEGLVNGSSYDALDTAEGLKLDAITEYVQHPILLAAPQDKLAPAPKPMYLTKKEQAKLRRQRRMADHKEEQAKIRLGLVPPPPPKVKKSNLMRVLGQEAVLDPTATEAMVNRQIEERADKHDESNEARKLTDEQRHDKLASQQDTDAAKGLRVAVFRVENLSFGQHRYKIDINAKQNALTGIVVLHPKMNLVIVEGGAHSVRAYRKLMLNRIKWEENAAPVGGAQRVTERAEDMDKPWLQSLDDEGRLRDLSCNRCTLVWEGEEKARAFKKWGSRVCETDGEAKDCLARMKMENMWTLAQSVVVDS